MTNSSSQLAKLQQIFRDELDNDSLIITASATPEQIAGWDSLANIRIVAAIENEFGFQFNIDQIESVKSVTDLLAAIDAHS